MPQSPEQNARALKALLTPATRLARILTRDRDLANDLVQETMVKVWARLNTGAEIDDLRPYLLTVLRHTHRRPGPVFEELKDRDQPKVQDLNHMRLNCADILAALTRLPPEQGDLLRDLTRLGTSYSDLAHKYDIPIGTVMSRLARARARLRQDFQLKDGAAVAELMADVGL